MTNCPCSQEQLHSALAASSYGRDAALHAERFTHRVEFIPMALPSMGAFGSPMLTTSGIPVIKRVCKACTNEIQYHARDGSQSAAWPHDCFEALSPEPCLHTTGYLRKRQKFPDYEPTGEVVTVPGTAAVVCSQCKHPIDAHDEAPDPIDAEYEKKGVADFMFELTKGRDGRPAVAGSESETLLKWRASRTAVSFADALRLSKAGPLSKFSIGRGGFMKNWKQRHVNYSGGVLSYAESPGAPAKNTIALSTNEGRRFVTRPTPKTHPEATAPDRDFAVVYTDAGKELMLLLRAADAADKASWCDALRPLFQAVDDPRDHPAA